MSQRRPEPTVTMRCPACGHEEAFYITPEQVAHRCPSRSNKWIEYKETSE